MELTTKIDAFGEVTGTPEFLDKNFKYEVLDAPEQGTDKWLAWRKQGITATEAGAIMFPDSHSSPMNVYTDKLGLTVRDQSDAEGYLEWGHRIEDLLIDKFMEVHPTFTRKSHGRLYQRDWAKCSLDGQCFDESGNPVIIECKTGQYEAKWNPIPNRYYAQVQWQMYVTGIRKTYFSVLISGHTWFEREVPYNPTFVKAMLERCKTVWDAIQSRTPPASLGFYSADKAAVSALAKESGHKGSPVEVEEETVLEYSRLKEQVEKAQAEFDAFVNALGYKMVDVQRLTYKGKTFASWVERKGSLSVDKEKLKREYPEAYEACLKQGLGSRYIRYAV